ncbi:hypothetical protein [Bradyrhizobium sp. OAE829]|uniref:hypothetical protein n=1 Tax=Bradyrhizobium sp. OAE829 TaxID=2663807 RepID=UPI00178AD638
MAATLDGVIKQTGAVFEATCCPGRFQKGAAAATHMAQVQHNMLVANTKTSVVIDHHRRRQRRRGHTNSLENESGLLITINH